ncbi:MAG: hypothetical protein M1820_009389 [Bogoriella megaspora]|nr:MAG: hypothetical protein M1820_009389 [Bogoriella megaspora]
MGTLLLVLLTLITLHEITDQDLPPAIVVPAVGVATLATVGGLVSSFSDSISARLAVPVIIFSFCAVGIGLFMAIFLYTLLLRRLLFKGWPAAPQTASLFMFVGPVGQSGAALQLLGSAADTYNRFGGYSKGTFLTRMAAMPLEVMCVLLGLLLLGLGMVWLIIAFYAMFYRAFRRELTWGIEWNAIIFPVGTLTTSTILFGIEMDSPFFKVITGILLVFLVLVFFINLAFTVWNVFKGNLLIVRDDPRVKQQLEEEQKEE